MAETPPRLIAATIFFWFALTVCAIFCALYLDVLHLHLCSHRFGLLTLSRRLPSLSSALITIAFGGLTRLIESPTPVPTASCTTCSTAPFYHFVATCKFSLRGLLYGFGSSGLVFGLYLWFFISIFVAFRQNGFQPAMRWVVSSGYCSLEFLDGFRSFFLRLLGLVCPALCFWFFIPIFVVFRQNGFQSATRWIVPSGCCSSYLVSCSWQDFLRIQWVAPLATFSSLPELVSPYFLPVLRGRVPYSFPSWVKHNGTSPQLPTELQQAKIPSWGMICLRIKNTKVLTSPATSRSTAPISSEMVATLLTTRAQQETLSPLIVARGGETTHHGPCLSLQERLECGVSHRIYRMTTAARLLVVPGAAALVREGALLLF